MCVSKHKIASDGDDHERYKDEEIFNMNLTNFVKMLRVVSFCYPTKCCDNDNDAVWVIAMNAVLHSLILYCWLHFYTCR